MLEKTGEVKPGLTTCDECEKEAVEIVGSHAVCASHAASTKHASVGKVEHLRSFTTPLPVNSDDT